MRLTDKSGVLTCKIISTLTCRFTVELTLNSCSNDLLSPVKGKELSHPGIIVFTNINLLSFPQHPPCLLRCSENKKSWNDFPPRPGFHGGGHFQPLEKNGKLIRPRLLFLFLNFQIRHFYIGFARKIQRKIFNILKCLFLFYGSIFKGNVIK